MSIDYVLAGRLTREYLLPPEGPVRIDQPGGAILYAAGGLSVWAQGIGLAARVGEDFPREWLGAFEQRGIDTRGVRVLSNLLDLRTFAAYSDPRTAHTTNPITHFARRGLPFPKALLGYVSPLERPSDPLLPGPDAPRAADLPEPYRAARAVHIAPLDLLSHSQLQAAFRQGGTQFLTLDPLPAYMSPDQLPGLRTLLQGLTAFLPSLEETRALFWGETNDDWAMAEALGSFGCAFVVIKGGPGGQLLYDSLARKRWEVPAYPARLADPTGQGAAFCGGFLAGLALTGDPLQAALYGNVSASLKIEGSGPFFPLEVLPGLAEARLQALRDIVREV